MADVTCIVTVGESDVVSLEYDGRSYRAPLQHRPLTRDIVQRLDSLITRMRSAKVGRTGYEKGDLELLGAVLFDILFGGQATRIMDDIPGSFTEVALQATLGDMLDQRLRVFEQAKQDGATGSFRISLSLEDDSRLLGTYPWEFLFVSRSYAAGFFLGEKTILTRALSPVQQLAVLPDTLDVWLAWSQPTELGPIDGADTLQGKIEAAIGRDAAVITPFKNVTLEGLIEALKPPARRPDILHIVAHGKLAAHDSEIALWRTPEQMAEARAAAGPQLRDQDVPRADWVSITKLAAVLKARPPRLVFLHACNLGRPAPGVESFKGAAETIARAGIPFVVAMQYEIEVRDAEAFATTFYAALGEGSTVDDAVRAGRYALGHPTWELRRFGTPVVYLRSESTRLVEPRAAPPPPHAMTAYLQPCPFEGCEHLLKALGRDCGCSRKMAFKFCGKQHANELAATRCWLRDCTEVFQQDEVARTPAMRRAEPRDIGEA